MKIALVCQYFPPEPGAPQARLSEHARFWNEAGHDVTVVTGFPNHPTGVIPAEYQGKRKLTETTDAGVEVQRCWLYATPNNGLVKKTLSHLSFMASSAALGPRATKGVDAVIASSPTFFSLFSGWWIAKRNRAAFVVEVRDLWPGVFVELGVLTNKWVIRALETIELRLYAAADHVVVVTHGFVDDLVRRDVPETKVSYIPNGVDLERFQPRPRDERWRERLGAAPDDMVALYVGAHGISHSLETLLYAAQRLEGSKVRIALVGDGAEKARLAELAQELDLANLIMLDSIDRDEMPALLSAADVCMASLRDVPGFAAFLPSKIFEYLGAGRPVVGLVAGESAAILRDAGGEVVVPQDSDGLADTLGQLAADPDRRRAMADRGRAYVEANFSRRDLAERYATLLHKVVGP